MRRKRILVVGKRAAASLAWSSLPARTRTRPTTTRRRHTRKSILERMAPPTFDIVVEIQEWDKVAIHPDVAVIHALVADFDGNALIGDNKGVDVELCLASKKVIITTEEIVVKLSKADLVAPCIHAVVLAPKGASPTSCHPLYAMNAEAILEYAEQVSEQVSFDRYLSGFINYS